MFPQRSLGRSPSRSRIWCIFDLKIWQLVATMILLSVNWPNFVQFSIQLDVVWAVVIMMPDGLPEWQKHLLKYLQLDIRRWAQPHVGVLYRLRSTESSFRKPWWKESAEGFNFNESRMLLTSLRNQEEAVASSWLNKHAYAVYLLLFVKPCWGQGLYWNISPVIRFIVESFRSLFIHPFIHFLKINKWQNALLLQYARASHACLFCPVWTPHLINENDIVSSNIC